MSFDIKARFVGNPSRWVATHPTRESAMLQACVLAAHWADNVPDARVTQSDSADATSSVVMMWKGDEFIGLYSVEPHA